MIFRPVDVLGQPVDPDITLLLHHEHLCCDATCWHQPSDDPQTQRAVADADLEDVRRRPWSYEDNLRLGDELVAEELGLIPSRRPAIIDVTPVDIGRSPEGLRALAVKTGVQVFMGCGRYVEGARAGETAKDAAFYRDEILRDLEEGVDGVRAGVIGEVGVSNPITPLEEVSLRGAAQAQRESGAPLLVHIDGWDPNAHEALDIVESEGAELDSTLVCHLDWSVAMRSLDYQIGILERGVYIAFDTWGDELEYGGNQQPTDEQRIAALLELAERGHGERILHSNDISTKTQLSRYGGSGYLHIPAVVFPRLQERGLDEGEIYELFVRAGLDFLGVGRTNGDKGSDRP
jgi:phosphotriesterase-related protein